MPRYGIAEWYGHNFFDLAAGQRSNLANIALGNGNIQPDCPFQQNRRPCHKRGGVCSIQVYEDDGAGRVLPPEARPVALCPSRFEQDNLLLKWLGDIMGFAEGQLSVAREIPFMENLQDNKPAGKIDLIVARDMNERLEWYGLEIQAVYFSGRGMNGEFEPLLNDDNPVPPYPGEVRRPDWRSSSAKRLMPQLQVKVPTLRRWGSKMAVAVDRPFFDSIGGPSQNSSQDLGDGDIIWLVPSITKDETGRLTLTRGHWEVLTLEDSCEKLLAARTIQRADFESTLRTRLVPLE